MESSVVEINLDKHVDLLDNYEFMEYALRNKLLNKDTKVNSRTLLDYAISSDRYDMYNLLIRYNVNINTQSCGRTPLYIACLKGNLELVDKLLCRKADPNIVETEAFGSSALYVAVWERDKNIVGRLLGAKANPTVGSKYGSPLHLLACANDVKRGGCFKSNDGGYDLADMLVQAKADISVKDTRGETPLTLAIDSCKNDIVSLFMKKCKISDQNLDAVMSAVGSDNIECLRVFEIDKRIVDMKSGGLTPLHFAVKSGSVNCVEHLLGLKANPNCKDESGSSPIIDAVNAKRVDIVRLLKGYGANSHGVIDLACESGNTEIVGILMNRKRKISFNDVVKEHKR